MSRTLVIAPAVADADAILAATALTTGTQTITTAIAQPDCYRVLSVTGNAAGITGSVTITGTDWDGDAITDAVALSGASTVNGVKPFRTVTSIALPIRNAGGDTVSVGVAAVFGLHDAIAAVTIVERASSTATAWTSEAVGTVSTTYNTVAATITAGDRLRITYTEAGTSSVATRLFTVAEARAFDKAQLADAALYPTATIADTETSIRAELADWTGVHFGLVTSAETHRGDGTSTMMLDWPAIQNIVAVYATDDDGAETVFTTTEVDDLVWDERTDVVTRLGGTFSSGYRYTFEYVNGLGTFEQDIKHAAMMECVRRLVPTDLPWEASGGNWEGIQWNLVRDPERGRFFANDKADTAVKRYRMRYWRPGIA